MSGVTVILLCKDQQANLPVILRALENQTRRPDEVLVVDDQSNINVAPLALRLGCRYVNTASHVSDPKSGLRALARQVGTEEALHDIILYLDGDIIPSRRVIDIGCEYAQNKTLIKVPRRYLLTADGRYVHNIPRANKFPMMGNLSYAQFSSDCFVISRNLINVVGGWDEHFEGWGEEDIELAYRIEQAGIRMSIIDHEEFFGTHINHSVNYAANCQSLSRNACYFAKKHDSILSVRAKYWRSMGVYLSAYPRAPRSRWRNAETSINFK